MLPKYFSELSQQINIESKRVREFFNTHKPTAGINREGLVGDFLKQQLPSRYGIDSGLIVSSDGEFSNQADLVVTDRYNSAPLFPSSPEPIWLVESIYALIEVKTQLSPTTIEDSIKKCIRFKELKRNFCDLEVPKIKESLFILWAFESPSPETAKENIVKVVRNVKPELRPDFIVVPGSFLCKSGSYYEISKIGQEGSRLRYDFIQKYGNEAAQQVKYGFEMMKMGDNALLPFIIWVTSWLKAAGGRSAPLHSYLPLEQLYGEFI